MQDSSSVSEPAAGSLTQQAVALGRAQQSDDRARSRRTRWTEIVLIGPTGEVVCDHCYLADRSFRRLRGLIGWKSLAATEGMLLRPSSSIHTALMRFPIDVVFLDERLSVL